MSGEEAVCVVTATSLSLISSHLQHMIQTNRILPY